MTGRQLSTSPGAIRSRRKRKRRGAGIKVAQVETTPDFRAWLEAAGWIGSSEDMQEVNEGIEALLECVYCGNFQWPGPAREPEASDDLKTNTHKRTIAPPR